LDKLQSLYFDFDDREETPELEMDLVEDTDDLENEQHEEERIDS
jgi:hypothetical protein